NGSGNGPSSILGRKNQIAGLQTCLAELHDQVNDTSRRKEALAGEQTALQTGLQQEQDRLRAQEVAIAAREGEFQALQNSRRVLRQKIETVVYEIQSLAAQEQEGRQKRAERTAQAGALQNRERELQQQLNDWSAGLDSLREQRDTAN